MLSAAVQEHERGLGNWPAEWETLPEIALLAAGALDAMASTVENLDVDADRMRANLQLLQGLLLAEAVQMALAPALGRDVAHALVAEAARAAIAQKRLCATCSRRAPKCAPCSTTRHSRGCSIRRHIWAPPASSSIAPPRAVSHKGHPDARRRSREYAAPLSAGWPADRAAADAVQFAGHRARDVGPADARAGARLPRAALRHARPRASSTARRPTPSRTWGAMRGPARSAGARPRRLLRPVDGRHDRACGWHPRAGAACAAGARNTAARIGPPDLGTSASHASSGGMAAIVRCGVLARWFTPSLSPASRPRSPREGGVGAHVGRRLRRLLRGGPRSDQRAAVARIATPTLVIVGSSMSRRRRRTGEFMAAEHARGARSARCATAHLSNVEAPPAFRAALSSFLSA